ncbi:MAG: hypothetical protein CTY37_03780 [Methylotenera sp.]|nr:MAG: hypothetical protein CTY37_03780 [Methylotenera sp.]
MQKGGEKIEDAAESNK